MVFKGTAQLGIQFLFRKQHSMYDLRRQNCFVLLKPKTNLKMKSVPYIGAKRWNNLPNAWRAKESLASFNKELKANKNLDIVKRKL